MTQSTDKQLSIVNNVLDALGYAPIQSMDIFSQIAVATVPTPVVPAPVISPVPTGFRKTTAQSWHGKQVGKKARISPVGLRNNFKVYSSDVYEGIYEDALGEKFIGIINYKNELRLAPSSYFSKPQNEDVSKNKEEIQKSSNQIRGFILEG